MKRGSIFETDGIPRIQEALPLALQHVVAMIVGCVTPAIIVAHSGCSCDRCVFHFGSAVSNREKVSDWFRTSHDHGCQLRICAKYAGHCGRIRN